MLDFTTSTGKRALERLQHDEVVWLTTVDSKGRPQPNPVWFVWEDETFLIYTTPDAARLKNMAKRPGVSLHFNSDAGGNDIVVFVGEAHMEPSAPPADQHALYSKKYREGIKSLGMLPPLYSKRYSVAFRVIPTKMRSLNIEGVDL